MKHIWMVLACTTLVSSCNAPQETTPWTIRGEAQGSTYQISGWEITDVQKSGVDSVLQMLDLSLSTWVKESQISRFNQDSLGIEMDDHFRSNLLASYQVYLNTDGAFNPLVKPLLDYWGFSWGSTPPDTVDSIYVEQLVNLTQFDQLYLLHEGDTHSLFELREQNTWEPGIWRLEKRDPKMQLDFNAIAQGYSVDVLANYLESKGLHHFLVELGGEMVVRGTKEQGDPWVIGIDKPVENNSVNNRQLAGKMPLKDQAVATSGNYRKYLQIQGEKFHHTLDPVVGFPSKHRLLSATVFASDCQQADAYATAFMVIGFTRTQTYLQSAANETSVMLIYTDSNESMQTYISPELEGQIEFLSASQ